MSKPLNQLNPTNNNLADIIRWLNENNCVFIHNGPYGGRFFHKCSEKAIDFNDLLNKTDVIYVDVSSHSNLLVDGEWNWYIENAGHKECTCGLRDVVSTIKNVPHKHIMRLGY